MLSNTTPMEFNKKKLLEYLMQQLILFRSCEIKIKDLFIETKIEDGNLITKNAYNLRTLKVHFTLVEILHFVNTILSFEDPLK